MKDLEKVSLYALLDWYLEGEISKQDIADEINRRFEVVRKEGEIK